MAMVDDLAPDPAEFAEFLDGVESRLRQALVAMYGPVDGREATIDALSWAWEHWERLSEIDNKPGYLYRVGQSAVRRFGSRPVPWQITDAVTDVLPDIEPGLLPALTRLSAQQRTVALLVHAHGWSQAEVARTLEINASTVREHLARAMGRLREELQAQDVN